MQITFSEKELEGFLCKGKNLEKYLGLKFIARQVNIPPAGIIDILAYHLRSKCWVIIELQKANLDAYGLIQGLSYLRFYKDIKSHIRTSKIKRKRNFCLLLVGNYLDFSLEKVVRHFDLDDDFIDEESIYYTLFNIEFDKGIGFDYSSQSQATYEEKINELSGNGEVNRVSPL